MSAEGASMGGRLTCVRSSPEQQESRSDALVRLALSPRTFSPHCSRSSAISSDGRSPLALPPDSTSFGSRRSPGPCSVSSDAVGDGWTASTLAGSWAHSSLSNGPKPISPAQSPRPGGPDSPLGPFPTSSTTGNAIASTAGRVEGKVEAHSAPARDGSDVARAD